MDITCPLHFVGTARIAVFSLRTVRGYLDDLERFVADWERSSGHFGIPKSLPPSGKKVGIIGSGPAGLACAGDLIQMGHKVHVFEALHEFGGVLVYGIHQAVPAGRT